LFETPRESPCFNLYEYNNEDERRRLQVNVERSGTRISPSIHPQHAWLEALTDVKVTPTAMRVVDLLVDGRQGY